MVFFTSIAKANLEKLVNSQKDFFEIITRPSAFWHQEGKCAIALDDDELELFNGVIDELFKSQYIVENYTRKEVEDYIRKIISNSCSQKKKRSSYLISEISRVEKELKKPKPIHTYLVPIDNLFL
ncbi:MAG: hypothetical protein ABH834_03350, partial [Candidatus Altiarchaeota archaeon]